MLHKKALNAAMDKFQVLGSPNIRNIIVTFRSSRVEGEEGRWTAYLHAMKRQAKIEFIHDSVFLE